MPLTPGNALLFTCNAGSFVNAGSVRFYWSTLQILGVDVLNVVKGMIMFASKLQIAKDGRPLAYKEYQATAF